MNNQFLMSEGAPVAAETEIFDYETGAASSARARPSLIKSILQFILLGGLTLGCYLLVSHYVLQSVRVVGESMFPTLQDSDYYFLNRFACYMHDPKRKDIVVIKDPSDGVYVVKRIVAMPGESVYFKSGAVFVNGKKIAEPYLLPGTHTYTNTRSSEELILCGKDQYYVLGDNRNNSYDSRMYGPVRRENILGVVMR